MAKLKVYHRRHKKKRRLPNWSELLPELLLRIMKNLSFVNILQFKAVCSSWKHAATPSHTPWLMLPSSSSRENDQNNPDSAARCFYSLEEQKVYTIKNAFQGFDHEARCVGSSHGWLVIMDSNGNPHLLNPFSRRQIQLPLILPFPRLTGDLYLESLRMCVSIAKAVLSSDPSRDNNFAVVAWEEDSRWTLLNVHREYCDVIFHNEQLFALAGDGSVEVWDFNNSFPIKTIDLRQPFAEIGNVDIVKDFSRGIHSTQTYLVESLGEILFVGRIIENFVKHEDIGEGDLRQDSDYICPYRTLHFYILKLNITANKWEKVESLLRNRALFLGGNQSMSVSTRDFPELEENSIYFTDDRWEEINYVEDYGGHDVGVYNLGNKIVKTLVLDQFNKWRVDPPPFWIVPNPW
ncbi:putative F-box protein [Prunus yedoensis var. nudiflora]|uniref:Putative F-box protein n=1 Tax=Prunus yedoensis var. nudiflora TaxID=2094558 RepID=A0A314XYQ1_PRUYE|nr:putative F-box protein [Prunus yedoensis var. nudiflora]